MRFVKMLSLIMTDQLRSAVFASIEQYANFWRQYDFSYWDECSRAGYHDQQLPEEWDAAVAEAKAGKRTADDANVYWRRCGLVSLVKMPGDCSLRLGRRQCVLEEVQCGSLPSSCCREVL